MPRQHPHDTFARAILGRCRDARGWLRHVLPPPLAERVVWGRLRVARGDDVDHRLRERRSDLVYDVPVVDLGGRSRRLTMRVVVEHQRRKDPKIGVRLLDRLVRAWTDHARDGGLEDLPLVLPIVLHTGSEAWDAGELAAPMRFDNADIDSLFLRFRWLHLSTASPGVVGGTDAAALALRLLGAQDHREALIAEKDRFRRVIDQGDNLAAEAVLRFVSQVQGAPLPADLFGDDEEARAMPMSYYTKLLRKGRQEGREASRGALVETVAAALRSRLGDLPVDGLTRLREMPEAELHTWLRRLLEGADPRELIRGS